MHDNKNDLRERTTEFALRIVGMYKSLPKTTEAQILGNRFCALARLWAHNSVKVNVQNRMLISSTNLKVYCRKPMKLLFG